MSIHRLRIKSLYFAFAKYIMTIIHSYVLSRQKAIFKIVSKEWFNCSWVCETSTSKIVEGYWRRSKQYLKSGIIAKQRSPGISKLETCWRCRNKSIWCSITWELNTKEYLLGMYFSLASGPTKSTSPIGHLPGNCALLVNGIDRVCEFQKNCS